MGINRGAGLGLEIPVSYELRGDPKYLIRLDKLINSSEPSKQSLGMEDEGLVSPKESGRKRHKLKWKRRVCCTATKEIGAKINIPEIF